MAQGYKHSVSEGYQCSHQHLSESLGGALSFCNGKVGLAPETHISFTVIKHQKQKKSRGIGMDATIILISIDLNQFHLGERISVEKKHYLPKLCFHLH